MISTDGLDEIFGKLVMMDDESWASLKFFSIMFQSIDLDKTHLLSIINSLKQYVQKRRVIEYEYSYKMINNLTDANGVVETNVMHVVNVRNNSFGKKLYLINRKQYFCLMEN